MIKKMLYICMVMVLSILLMNIATSCNTQVTTTTTTTTTTTISMNKVSEKVVIDIPSSLTDETTNRGIFSGTLSEEDKMLKGTMKNYYSLVKDQIKLASRFSKIVKNMVYEFENVKIESVPLFKIKETITYTEPTTDNKIKFTPKGNNEFLLEYWINLNGNTYKKYIEMAFYYADNDGTIDVRGSLIFNTVANKLIISENGDKKPEFVKIDFDSNKNGKQYMKVSLYKFKFTRELDKDSIDQNAIVEFSKDASGVVDFSGNIMVPGSRWFVWNGYKHDNTIDTTSTPEIRYYVFTGKVKADNKATVNIGIGKNEYTDDKIFTEYSIGNVIKKLYADRLNNNYIFSADTTNTGRNIIKNMNYFLSDDEKLDENGDNTADKLLTAFKKVVSSIPSSEQKTFQNLLISLMEVENPVYFIEGDFSGYGSVSPTGFFTGTDIESIVKVGKETVTNLDIVFQNSSDNPEF